MVLIFRSRRFSSKSKTQELSRLQAGSLTVPLIVNVAYTLVFNTGLFPDACRAWQSRAIAEKTWAQFKIEFATAHREFRLTNQTAQQSGFHSANMMIEQGRDDSMHETAEDAVAQLATATASDRGTVATLTTTNAKLANQLEAAHALIAQLKNEIATLKNKIKPAWQGQRPAKTTNNDSYCWSHGYQVAKSHTSATCNIKKRTSRCCDEDRHHGWRTMGQRMMRRGS
jgi:hypothetical protein